MAYGAKPSCRVLPIAPSTYYAHSLCLTPAEQRSPQARRDDVQSGHIRWAREENFQAHGVHKVWQQLLRKGIVVVRCTVEQLMRQLGLQASYAANRQRPRSATRPTLVRRIRSITNSAPSSRMHYGCRTPPTSAPGWALSTQPPSLTSLPGRSSTERLPAQRVSTSAGAGAVCPPPADRGGLTHHSDHGVQYLSVRHTEHLTEAEVEPSAGSVGDSYDNALAETINGLHKAKVIQSIVVSSKIGGRWSWRHY